MHLRRVVVVCMHACVHALAVGALWGWHLEFGIGNLQIGELELEIWKLENLPILQFFNSPIFWIPSLSSREIRELENWIGNLKILQFSNFPGGAGENLENWRIGLGNLKILQVSNFPGGVENWRILKFSNPVLQFSNFPISVPLPAENRRIG